MDDLFGQGQQADPPGSMPGTPLADRMRPRRLADVVGQESVLGPDTPLGASLARGVLPSLILWGPPGCGKTTLAGCLTTAIGRTFLPYSAVRVGVKELKQVMAEAAKLRRLGNAAPVLFLDEIHRFNKAQQDALLPHVEAGDIILIGATTENPSFEINAALLSRARVIVLDALGEESLFALLRRALDEDDELRRLEVGADDDALRALAQRAGGDARFALASLEAAAQSAAGEDEDSPRNIDEDLAKRVLAHAHLIYDKAGEEHFNLISALHKSLRNSDAQAGLYWLVRMLESGEQPEYIARRLIRFASEDVGLADPGALVQAVSASEALRQIGMPEGALALAQATIYLAQAPKSNSLEVAYDRVKEAMKQGRNDPVPLHLRNAPTGFMRQIGYGDGYRYAPDEPEGVAEMECLPAALAGSIFYRPGRAGFEAEAAERLRVAWRRSHPKRTPSSEDPKP